MTFPKITEREFTDQVIQFAKLHGWRVAHFRAARTSKGWRTPVQGDGAGFPDLVLVRGIALLFVELKVGKNKPTVEQEVWLEALGRCASVRVWRPEDWPLVEAALR